MHRHNLDTDITYINLNTLKELRMYLTKGNTLLLRGCYCILGASLLRHEGKEMEPVGRRGHTH